MLYMLEVKDKKGQPINIEKFSPLTYSIGSDSYAYAVVKILYQQRRSLSLFRTEPASGSVPMVTAQATGHLAKR
jgi:hypothetical protein